MSVNWYFGKNWIHFSKNWLHLELNKLLYISCSNPFSTMKKLKEIFVPLKSYVYIGRYINSPLWYTNNDRGFITITSSGELWKDKYKTPRFEEPPFISFSISKYCITFYWSLPPYLKDYSDDDYWEQALWYLNYYKNYDSSSPDLKKAIEKWPWTNIETNNSTWNNKFLTSKILDKII